MANNQDENFDILRSTKRYIKGISESINDNGNVNGGSPMGAMLNIGSTTTKSFYLQDDDYVPKHTADLHKSGAIHIHDLDFFSMTTTCAQIPLLHLLLREVYMEHGWIRKAKSFSTACSLACIYLQSNQNDHHGGQGYPHFDYFLARFVSLEWLRQVKVLLDYTEEKPEIVSNLRDLVDEGENIIFNSDPDDLLFDYFKTESFEKIQNEISIHFPSKLDTIEQNLRKEVFSGCQGILYNFNSMHSRAGGQVPFSSINLGTDTSYGGRLITEGILTELQKGLGHGEICIFPIVIFKLKNGLSALPGDPNYDLYRLALKSAATRLYPTFLFLDAPFNLVYQDGNPIHEIALMGCVDYNESIKFSGYLKSSSDRGNKIGYYYDMVDFMYNNLDKIKDMENEI